MLIFPEISWFNNQAKAVIHVYRKRLSPFHIFRDPGKIDEKCLLELSMQIHLTFGISTITYLYTNRRGDDVKICLSDFVAPQLQWKSAPILN
jgi:hypothetical protein